MCFITVLMMQMSRGTNALRPLVWNKASNAFSTQALASSFATTDKNLATELKLPYLEHITSDGGIVEVIRNIDDNKLELLCNTGVKESPFRIDFRKGKFLQRLKSSNQELVSKALAGSDLVIDFTAGMGRDAMILASSGIDVVMVERNYLLYLLLDQAREELKVAESSLYERIRLFNFDAIRDINKLENMVSSFDGQKKHISVYLDPMYPGDPRARKSAVKKDTQILHMLANSQEGDHYHASLISSALKLANYKVVVKRPKSSSWIHTAFEPNVSLHGSTQRFDIYLNARLPQPQNCN